jgi:hypothetical protein
MFNFEQYLSQHCELQLHVSQGQLTKLNFIPPDIHQQASGNEAMVRCGQQSESESELLDDWRFTAKQFFLAPSHLRLMARIFFSIGNLRS